MTLRQELQAVSPRVRFVGVRPLSVLVAPHTAPWRLGATLCIGIWKSGSHRCRYWTVQPIGFRVAQMRHEIALRGALGASRGRVTGMILKDGCILIGTGVSVGFVIARAFQSLDRTTPL